MVDKAIYSDNFQPNSSLKVEVVLEPQIEMKKDVRI